MKENLKELTQEEFNLFINSKNIEQIKNIAFAHGVANQNGELLYLKAFGKYPIAYKVTEEQKQRALFIFEQEKKAQIKKYSDLNTLVFISMGASFKVDNEQQINNHRIRAYFINNDGIKCFIEVGTEYKDLSFMRCDHAIFNVADNYKTLREREAREKNNYKNLEHNKGDYLKYTYENLLNLVNQNFNCSFNSIYLDNFFLSCDDFISISRVA